MGKIIKRIILAVLIILAALYVGVQIYNQFDPGISTETATRATVTDSVQVDGLVIRKEALVQNTTSGVISYVAENGAKVAGGGVIASVYASAEAAAEGSRRQQLQTQLEQLEDLAGAAEIASVNPDNVDKQIYQKLYTLQTEINDFNLTDITTERDSMLNLINQWQLATGKATTFADRISSLKAEIAALKTAADSTTGSIKAETAGYFVKAADGYETVYDYDSALQLTVEDLEQEREPETLSDTVIGKVCEQFDWYIACVVPADTAVRLGVGSELTVSLPSASSTDIPATVAAINQEDVNSDAALILRCSYMDASLAGIRNETVLLNIKTYEGIRISQYAVHFETLSAEVTDENGNTTTETRQVSGVYVVDGTSLKFVQIVPLYTTGNYIICDANPDESELLTDSTIGLYDNVAIGGNLYDGKSVG